MSVNLQELDNVLQFAYDQQAAEQNRIENVQHLVESILQQRDALAKLLGLKDLELSLSAYSLPGNNTNEASRILSAAIEIPPGSNSDLNHKLCNIYRNGNRYTAIQHEDRRFYVTLGHNKLIL